MLGLVSLLATGCIVPDAPEYGSPTPTPIFVQENTISPDPRSVIHFTNAAPNLLTLSFQVQSEDLPEDGVVSAVYLDYKHVGGRLVDHKGPLPALTFDVPRPISWPFVGFDPRLPGVTEPPTPGCHVLTVIVLHASGWDADANKQIGNPQDLAAVNWLVDLNEPQTSSADMPSTTPSVPVSTCPDMSSMTSSAP